MSRNVDVDVDRARDRLAGALAPLFAHDPLPDRLGRILEAVYGEAPGIDAYGVTVFDGDDVVVAAASSPLVQDLYDLQVRTEDGPCWDTLHGSHHTAVYDAIASTDAGAYRAGAAERGVRSQMTARIQPRKRVLGIITVVSTSTDVVPVEVPSLELVGQLAGLVVDQTIVRDGIEDGLRGRTVIGIATGLLMERHGWGEAEALDHLKHESSTTHRKVRALAEDLVRASGTRTRRP